MRIPTAVRRCSAPHYGLLANFFFPSRNAPFFPGTTGLPDGTTPWAPFERLLEPPPREEETARTAGSCGRAGGATTPALSPAFSFVLRRALKPAQIRPKIPGWSRAPPTSKDATEPLTARHRSRSVPAVPGVPAHAVARCSAPCSPASDGSAGGPRPGVAAG